MLCEKGIRITVLSANFIEKETQAQVFSCEFYEIFKNTHMFRLSRFQPDWEGSSRPPVSFWNLPFWVDPCMAYLSRSWSLLECQIFMNFSQVDHTFYKFEVKPLAASNEIRCVHSFWLPFSSTSRFVSTKVLIVLVQSKGESARSEFENWYSL